MKLCKDCKHYKLKIAFPYWKHYCKYYLNVDLITGAKEYDLRTCYDMRLTYAECDKEAKLFEPKKKWWRFWK